MSAPSSSGRCSSGVANTLSTTTLAPARWASALTAARSTSSSVGLPGDSRKTRSALRRERPLPGGEILAVDQLDLDAEARAELGQDPVAGAEQQGRADDPHAGAQLAHQRRVDRRHAAGRGGAILRALEQRHALLEHAHGRVADARVGVALLRLGEAGLGVLGALVAEARGEEERLGGLAMRRAVGPAMDELGLRAPGGRHRIGLQTTTPRPMQGQGVVASRPFSGAPGCRRHPVAWPASRPAQISTLRYGLRSTRRSWSMRALASDGGVQPDRLADPVEAVARQQGVELRPAIRRTTPGPW